MAPLCLYAPFNYLKATDSLRGESLFLNTKLPGPPGTDLINLNRLKD